MEWIRRGRIPVVVATGVVYVALLPWLGWHWAQPVLLLGTVAVFFWLPAIARFIRNLRVGYAEEQ